MRQRTRIINYYPAMIVIELMAMKITSASAALTSYANMLLPSQPFSPMGRLCRAIKTIKHNNHMEALLMVHHLPTYGGADARPKSEEPYEIIIITLLLARTAPSEIDQLVLAAYNILTCAKGKVFYALN